MLENRRVNATYISATAMLLSPGKQQNQAGEGWKTRRRHITKVSHRVSPEHCPWQINLRIMGLILTESILPTLTLLMISAWWLTHHRSSRRCWMNIIHTTIKPVGVNMLPCKTKVTFNKHATPANIVVEGTTIEQVENFIYVGKTITKDGSLLTEV